MDFMSICLFIIAIFLALISIALLITIFKYTQGKPPGLQTQLDLQILDNTRIWISFTVLFVITLVIGVFHGNLGFHTAQVIMGLFSIISHLIVSSLTVTLILKGVLVFKSNWLDDVQDEKVQKISRATTGAYATTLQLLSFIWKYVNGSNIVPPLMAMLTKANQPT